jgi:hypothetical protein
MSASTPSNIPTIETVDLKGLTRDQMLAEIARLRGENKTLVAAQSTGSAPGITFKIGEKGGVSIYGLGKFPVSLYPEQVDRVFGKTDDEQGIGLAVKAFTRTHRHLMATKGKPYVRSAEAAAVKGRA